jgi:hypothetical protein
VRADGHEISVEVVAAAVERKRRVLGRRPPEVRERGIWWIKVIKNLQTTK